MKLSSNLFENDFFCFFWEASYDISVHQTFFSFMNVIMKEWTNYFRSRVGTPIKPNTLKASMKIYILGGGYSAFHCFPTRNFYSQWREYCLWPTKKRIIKVLPNNLMQVSLTFIGSLSSIWWFSPPFSELLPDVKVNTWKSEHMKN